MLERAGQQVGRVSCSSVVQHQRRLGPLGRRREPLTRVQNGVAVSGLKRAPLHRGQLRHDRLLVRGQALRQRGERGRELGVVGLGGQLPRPVQGEVEVAPAVVDLADLPRRRPPVLQQ